MVTIASGPVKSASRVYWKIRVYWNDLREGDAFSLEGAPNERMVKEDSHRAFRYTLDGTFVGILHAHSGADYLVLYAADDRLRR